MPKEYRDGLEMIFFVIHCAIKNSFKVENMLAIVSISEKYNRVWQYQNMNVFNKYKLYWIKCIQVCLIFL